MCVSFTAKVCHLILTVLSQVVYLKGEQTSDIIILDPRWFCGSGVCGHLLSEETVNTKVKSTGVYSPEEFHLVSTNSSEAAAASEQLLPILEALGMCTQVHIT